MMDVFLDLTTLLNARNIAGVGGPELRGSAGRVVLENLRDLTLWGSSTPFIQDAMRF